METFAPAYFDYMSSSVYADVSGFVAGIEIGLELVLTEANALGESIWVL